ncbi:MAG: M56 family metallopeptidase [Bacteroidaceae bacterium]|nr:M56 family metallopeptidase [Bacteroidaceae bacterium]
MSQIVFYSFSVIACSGLSMLLYNLFVSRKAGYTFCRRYLLIAMLLSVVIPTLNIPLYHINNTQPQPEMRLVSNSSAGYSLLQEPVQTTAGTPAASAVEVSGTATSNTVSDAATLRGRAFRLPGFVMMRLILFVMYLAGVLISFGLIIKSIIYISRIKNRSLLTSQEGYMIAENVDVKSPFSFLHTIFMGSEYSSTERSQILSHEISHVKHHHSHEKLVMSVLRSVFWFNPFMLMAEKSLEEVQEWQADNDALSCGYSVDDYRDTVIRMLFGISPLTTAGMGTSFTKKRLLRMSEKESSGHMAVVWMFSIMLASVLFFCFGCKAVIDERFVRDDDKEMPDHPQFNKTEGEYRKYIEKDDRMFLMIDNFVYGKKGDSEPIKRTFFDESHDSWTDLSRGLEFVENTTLDSYPTMICINGYKCADFPTSKSLKWVDDKTIIVIGDRLSTVDEFRRLRPDDYMCIVYYRPRAGKRDEIPSLVYAITPQSVDYYGCYNYWSLIDTPDADLPDVVSPGTYGIHGRYSVYSCNKHMVAVTPHYAVNGSLVSLEEFKELYGSRKYGFPHVLRNAQAKRFGDDVRVVVEISSNQNVYIHFSNYDGLIKPVINDVESNLDDLKNLSKRFVSDQKFNDHIYVDIAFDQTFEWMTDEFIENAKGYIPWDDPSLVINAYRKVWTTSKPDPSIGFNRYTREDLVPVLP